MTKPEVLIAGEVLEAKDILDSLASDYKVHLLDKQTTRAAFFEDCKDKYNAIKAIYRTNGSSAQIGTFDAELIQQLPETVKCIAHVGAGYDQVDVHAAKARHITVTHTPSAVDDATATTAMYLILSAFRLFSHAESNARKGNFKSGLTKGRDPEDKVLGIIGMGGVGKAVARRALGFRMKIHYHNRKPIAADDDAFPCTYHASMDSLLAQCDVVLLAVPLNANTKNLLNAEAIAKMKKGAILVNVARGGVLDEEAVMAALDSGHLSAAGFDVYPEEPRIHPKLCQMQNVALLPHVGTFTHETEYALEKLAFENVALALRDEPMKTVVPEHH